MINQLFPIVLSSRVIASCQGAKSSDNGPNDSIQSGTSQEILSNFDKYEKVEAKASLIREPDSGIITVEISGLTPNKEYPAYVHTLPCAENAGNKYQNMTAVENKGLTKSIGNGGEAEINLTFTTDAAGKAKNSSETGFYINESAASLVISEESDPGEKLICIDFN